MGKAEKAEHAGETNQGQKKRNAECKKEKGRQNQSQREWGDEACAHASVPERKRWNNCGGL